MIRVLVFGSSGIAGNAIFTYLHTRNNISCFGTFNKNPVSGYEFGLFSVNVFNIDTVEKVISIIRPDWVINCVALTRKKNSRSNYFFVNSIFPQLLSYYSSYYKFQFIQLSSNAVFEGKKGSLFSHKDIPQGKSLYAISKILGEKINGILIRTSLIGHSLNRREGLIDWLLEKSNKKVEGYTRVFWNGITTLTLAKIIERIISDKILHRPHIVHLAGEVISKYELLQHVAKIYERKMTISKNGRIKQNITLLPSPDQKLYFDDLVTSIDQQLQELKNYYKI